VQELLATHKLKLKTDDVLRVAIEGGAKKTVQYLTTEERVHLSYSGPSLLHLASRMGNEQIMQVLVSHGLNINTLDKERKVPLHLACEKGDLGVCKQLLSQQIPLLNIPDRSRKLPLHYAAESGHSGILRLLIDKGSDIFSSDQNGRSPLHLVCQKGFYEAAKTLLDSGAQVDVKDRDGRTPLHYAAESGKVDLVWSLVASGASISAQDDDGASSLHLAAMQSSAVMINWLIRLGADPNAHDQANRSPLFYLFVKSDPDPSQEVFHALLKNGAFLDLQEFHSFDATMLHLKTKKRYKWMHEYQGTAAIRGDSSLMDLLFSEMSGFSSPEGFSLFFGVN
jgi:ankyrin repeat protein